MHVIFYRSPKERCGDFCQHFEAGIRVHGDTFEDRSINGELATYHDVAVVLGVKKARLFAALKARSVPMVYIDKGYIREWTHRRISIGACQPSHYLGKWNKPSDRRLEFGWIFSPWRGPEPWRMKHNGHILLAWSSPGYHLHMGLPSPEIYATEIVKALRNYTNMPIIYRQKPNQQRIPVPGTTLSAEGTSIEDDLKEARVMITVGSSVCLQACMLGVPTIVLGDAIGRPISSHDLYRVETPYLASNIERAKWLNDLAYCQWSLKEYASGEAWAHVRLAILGNIFK